MQVALNLADTDQYWDELGQLLAPQGHVGLMSSHVALRIGDPYKAKCIGIHTNCSRARFATADRIEQHRILSRAASMIDAGQLRGTLGESLGTINAANLDIAHQRLASGRTVASWHWWGTTEASCRAEPMLGWWCQAKQPSMGSSVQRRIGRHLYLLK